MLPLVTLLLTSLGSPAPGEGGSAASAAWVRVDTPNFVVYGESGERRVREVAAQFERFREALGRVIAGGATRSAVPTVVVVFDTRRTFDPYRPAFNGKPIALAGFFRATEDQNLVALTIEDRASALRVIFHEYTHLVISNVSRELPAWLNEGLAEYYSTFLVRGDGREATLGHVIASHLRLLNENRLMPLDQLLAVDRDSPMYNEGQRRSLFYAQSWALVHFLTSGEPSRSAELARYIRATASGTPPLDAWREVFGTLDVIPALQRYVSRNVMRGFTYKFTEGIDPVESRAVTLSAADTEAALADLLRRGQDGAAAARLEKAIALQPPSARARALLGLIRAREDRPADDDEAYRLLVAAAADSDWLVQYHVASGLTHLLTTASDSTRAGIAEHATHAVDAVLAARPDLPNALALRARIADEAGGDLPRAVASIRRARSLAPGRDDYAFIEARLLERQGGFAAARDVLGPMMSGVYPPEVRDRSRALMAGVVSREKRAARGSGDGPPPPPGSSAPSGVQPLYRDLEAGESRTEGFLERIDCPAGRVVIHLRTSGVVAQFLAGGMEYIDFISYRPDMTGEISCGPRNPPDRVYVTWRATPSTPRGAGAPTVVAIEFLGGLGT